MDAKRISVRRGVEFKRREREASTRQKRTSLRHSCIYEFLMPRFVSFYVRKGVPIRRQFIAIASRLVRTD